MHDAVRLGEVLRRMADLERMASLSPSELTELNALRTELLTHWPHMVAAVVRAYLAAGRSPG